MGRTIKLILYYFAYQFAVAIPGMFGYTINALKRKVSTCIMPLLLWPLSFHCWEPCSWHGI